MNYPLFLGGALKYSLQYTDHKFTVTIHAFSHRCFLVVGRQIKPPKYHHLTSTNTLQSQTPSQPYLTSLSSRQERQPCPSPPSPSSPTPKSHRTVPHAALTSTRAGSSPTAASTSRATTARASSTSAPSASSTKTASRPGRGSPRTRTATSRSSATSSVVS